MPLNLGYVSESPGGSGGGSGGGKNPSAWDMPCTIKSESLG